MLQRYMSHIVSCFLTTLRISFRCESSTLSLKFLMLICVSSITNEFSWAVSSSFLPNSSSFGLVSLLWNICFLLLIYLSNIAFLFLFYMLKLGQYILSYSDRVPSNNHDSPALVILVVALAVCCIVTLWNHLSSQLLSKIPIHTCH